MKKLLSIILSISMLLTASAIGVSAILGETGEYIADENTETYRYYFWMPEDWYNEYSDTAGVYWWYGTDACATKDNIWWPGYKANKSQEENIFYVDCPTDVPIIVWNNYLDGGTDTEAYIYTKAMQATDARVEYYSDGDTDIYDTEFFKYVEDSFYGDKSTLGKYADNFFIDEEYDLGISFTMDNMIYVIDLSKTVENFSGKLTHMGEWYFYYGNREYGSYPLKEDAEKYGTVGTLPSYDPIYTPEETIPFRGNEPTTEPITEPSTPPVTIPEGESFIYFDVKKSGWQNVDKVFCHIWRPDGTAESHQWQSKKEVCEYDETTGIASYDLSKLKFPVTSEDGKEFCVIFSANTGTQTYNTVMSGSCIGDTMYCIDLQVESPEDSEKKVMTAVWRNNPDCGPQKRITSTGNIIGTAHVEGTSDETILADYLISYCRFMDITESTQKLVNELKVLPDDVMDLVIEKVGEDDPYGKITIIRNILDEIEEPIIIFECDLNNDGFTNIIDATMIQKYAVELEAFTKTQLNVADVNNDGVVNVTDGTKVQKYLAGIL